MTAYPVLTVTTFLPLVGVALVLLVGSERLARWIALATTLATMAVSAPLYWQLDKTSSTLQFVESREWIPSWNIVYGMGVDGISVPFIFLAALLSIDRVKLRRTVVPGDQLTLEVETLKLKARTGRVHGRATVEGELAAEARMNFMLLDE